MLCVCVCLWRVHIKTKPAGKIISECGECLMLLYNLVSQKNDRMAIVFLFAFDLRHLNDLQVQHGSIVAHGLSWRVTQL